MQNLSMFQKKKCLPEPRSYMQFLTIFPAQNTPTKVSIAPSTTLSRNTTLPTRQYNKSQLLYGAQIQIVFSLHHRRRVYGQYRQDFPTTIKTIMKCLT